MFLSNDDQEKKLSICLAQGEKVVLKMENQAVLIFIPISIAKPGTITSNACFHVQLKNQEYP